MSHKVIECEQHVHMSGSYVVPQKHTGYEIVYYMSGNGTTTIDGETFDFKPDSFAFIKSGSLHDESTNVSGMVLFCVFSVDEDDMFPIDNCVVIDENGCNKCILDILEKIYHERAGNLAYSEEIIDLLIRELLIIVKRLIEKSPIKTDSVHYLEQYIKKMYRYSIDFTLVCEEIGYSYDRMRHIFVERNGCTISQYLVNTRISEAKRFLKETDLSVSDIAEICGYKNSANFVAAFRKKMKVTPLQYRIQLKKNDNKVVVFKERDN